MKLISIICFIFLQSIIVQAQTDSSALRIGDKWDALDKKIIFRQIDKETGAKLLEEYEKELVKYFLEEGGRFVQRKDWVFPLRNFTLVTHRDEGEDYKDDEFDYFQGSDTKGHPAHDIFILDNDKNLLDDSTGKPVDIVTMSSGVVVAVDTTWYVGSYLRGGQYVKIFDPTNYKYFYYSHLSQVNVKPGQIVNAGDKIGEVGRTGRKTIMPQGKTHLHVALMKSVKGYPYPEPIIEDIWRSKEKYIKDIK
jgi:peptidoglycan LD-endopeptidase LytH